MAILHLGGATYRMLCYQIREPILLPGFYCFPRRLWAFATPLSFRFFWVQTS